MMSHHLHPFHDHVVAVSPYFPNHLNKTLNTKAHYSDIWMIMRHWYLLIGNRKEIIKFMFTIVFTMNRGHFLLLSSYQSSIQCMCRRHLQPEKKTSAFSNFLEAHLYAINILQQTTFRSIIALSPWANWLISSQFSTRNTIKHCLSLLCSLQPLKYETTDIQLYTCM